MGWHRLSWAAVACAAALAGEGYALRAFLSEAPLTAAASHVAACIAVVVVAGRRCGPRQRAYRRLVAAALCACLPGAGPIGMVCVLLPIWWRRAPAEASLIVECEPAEPRDACRESAALAELLLDARARPLEQNMRRLRALRCLPLVAALPHWRAALRHPSEELRLLAHALIAQRETRRQAGIERAQALLDSTTTHSGRWSALRTLAFAHWELVCSERLPAESMQHALAAASERAQAALAIHPEAQLCLLLARVCLRQSDGAGASHWLQRAGCLGISIASRALLHAEAAFLQRRFEQIPHWLRQVSEHELRTLPLSRVRVFWSSEVRNWREHEPSSEQ